MSIFFIQIRTGHIHIEDQFYPVVSNGDSKNIFTYPNVAQLVKLELSA